VTRPAAAGPSTLSVTIPMKLQSLANCRLHWRALDRLKREQKRLVALALWCVPRPPLPAVVTVTRIAPRQLDSHDNLRSAAKYVVDEIARCYGVDDRSELYQWRYAQERGPAAVRIEVAAAG
jgi:hypothetical protein